MGLRSGIGNGQDKKKEYNNKLGVAAKNNIQSMHQSTMAKYIALERNKGADWVSACMLDSLSTLASMFSANISLNTPRDD